MEDNGGEVVSTAVVRGEAAVSDGLPTVTVGEGNGVPTVSGGDEAITNDTTGDVGGADAGGALHPPPPDCGSGAHVAFCWCWCCCCCWGVPESTGIPCPSP